MLRVTDLEVLYDDFQILWGVSLTVQTGEIVCLLGPNGAGKSTLLNTVSGLLKAKKGVVEFQGKPITNLPTHQIVAQGLSHVLERRRVFPYLTVYQNLLLGSYLEEAKKHRAETLAWVSQLFPILAERQKQLAHSLSGGEQQMLAIARGLMSRPKLLLIDEPFLGLAPQIVEEIIEIITKINREEGISVLFIEQNVQLALSMAHRGYILESGRLALAGTGSDLLRNEEVKKVYLGV
jgi:branched-chain amino acid transport system ATP-binding protein